VRFFYDDGIHAIIDNIHILIDPSFTTNKEIDWDELKVKRKSKRHNPNYDSVDIILLTHAHADHCDRLDQFKHTRIPLLCHPMTYELKKKVLSAIPKTRQILQDTTETFESLTITTKESGHCGGSMMFFVESNEGNILFTGDYNTVPALSQNPAFPTKCDVLVTEATFGNAKYTFSLRNQVYGDLMQYIDRKKKEGHPAIIMFGQGLGKAQDIVSLIEVMKDKNIDLYMDHYSLLETNIFSKHYECSKRYSSIKNAPLYPSETFAIFFYHMMIDSMGNTIDNAKSQFGLIKPPIAILTGWNIDKLENIKKKFKDVEMFQISNHCGYNSLISFIEQTEAKFVVTFHGSANELASSLRSMDIDAHSIHKGLCKFKKDL